MRIFLLKIFFYYLVVTNIVCLEANIYGNYFCEDFENRRRLRFICGHVDGTVTSVAAVTHHRTLIDPELRGLFTVRCRRRD